MSSGAEGVILAVPLVVVGGAAAAAAIGVVLVAGVGVGVCYMAGRGLVAGTQAVHHRCQAHAAQRRAWEELRQEVYRRSLQPMGHRPTAERLDNVRATRRAQAQTLAGLGVLEAWLAEPVGAPSPVRRPTLDEQFRVEWPTPGQTRIIDALDQEEERENLNARRRAAARHLREYTDGNWQGLFVVAPLQKGLAEVTEEIDQGRFVFAAERLRAIEQRLALMESETLGRWRERAAALRRLAEAGAALDALALDEDPAALAQVETLTQLLDEAVRRQAAGDFVGAAAAAAAVARQATTATRDAQAWQQALLLSEAQALRAEIAAHGQLEESEKLLALLDLSIGELSADTAPAPLLARVAQTLTRANGWADAILQRVETVGAGTTMRQIAAHACAEQLAAMNYTVNWSHPLDAPPAPEAKWRLVGERPAPADPQRRQRFVIELSADGGIWFDVTQGYKDKECDELKTFLAGLEARGIRGQWSPFYSAERAAEHFRQMLDAEGYFFYEERSDEGLVYTLIKDGQTTPGVQIPWNGHMAPIAGQEAPLETFMEAIQKESEELERLRQAESQKLRY